MLKVLGRRLQLYRGRQLPRCEWLGACEANVPDWLGSFGYIPRLDNLVINEEHRLAWLMYPDPYLPPGAVCASFCSLRAQDIDTCFQHSPNDVFPRLTSTWLCSQGRRKGSIKLHTTAANRCPRACLTTSSLREVSIARAGRNWNVQYKHCLLAQHSTGSLYYIFVS